MNKLVDDSDDSNSLMKRYQLAIEDTSFMAWFTHYEPDWKHTYSGDIVGMYDAWQAGQASPK